VHTADGFPGGRSLRSDGFRKVFAQDAALKASECGGPVFDGNGRFVGINIGRHSRTSTIVMPADVIAEFVNNIPAGLNEGKKIGKESKK
jgi:serine protease Do